jgi:hypothetical protein
MGGRSRRFCVTTAPVVFSPLVGGRSAVYEKKMRGQLAFDRTLAYLPLWPPFFIRAAFWLVIAAWIGSLSHSAKAQQATPDPTWAIEISPQSVCAGDPELEERLWAQIPQRQRAPVAGAELRVRVSVGRDQSATVAVYDQQTAREAGQRRIALSQPGCRAAGDALALVVAVMIEAGRVALAPQPDGEKPAPPPPPPPPPPEKPPAEAQRPPAQHYVRPERHAWQGPPAGHDLALLVGTSYGLLPGWGLGAQLGWGIRGHRLWPIWISASGWLNQTSSDERAEIGTAYGTLSTCPLYLTPGRFRVRLCPGFAVGAMWASGRNLPGPEDKVSLLTMASLAGAAHVKLVGPLELIVDVRVEVPLERLKFVYESISGAPEQIFITHPVTGSFFGGLGLRFR